jgi:exodeoxyribonuclease V beta subunit
MTFDPANDDFVHGLVIEASAGTGKTYSVAAIVTRELALRDDLRISQILITTYTRNAAAELRDRVRRRLVETAGMLRKGDAPADDRVATRLLEGTAQERSDRIRRLERALAEFDSATITTIHGVCSRVLRAAGIETGSSTDTDEVERIRDEIVNDMVVSRSTKDHRWDETKIGALVKEMQDDPFVTPWFDPKVAGANTERLEELKDLLEECMGRIHAAMAASPSYADLLRIARELVCDPERADLLTTLKHRFSVAIVDEAQDTDGQQWAFFQRLFPGGDGRALITVGDPKQAIYGFRGADVGAYVGYANSPGKTHATLDTNRRSDQPVLDALNTAFAGREFGEGIKYRTVHASAKRKASLIEGMAESVEFVDLGVATNQSALCKPVLDKVIELLEVGRLKSADAPAAQARLIDPKDICVLVRSGGVGKLIQRELARAKIPAVTGGTSSVMTSTVADCLWSLLEAMERPSNTGRVRRAAATVFFGHSLENAGTLTDAVIESVQDKLMQFSGVLAKKGIAALGAVIEADEAIMTRLVAGPHGERNITDFLHVIEVMDSCGSGRGCSAAQALLTFSTLANMDGRHELVSRRVESDADAVRILTIHGAKGLEFPCVIVADLWKEGGSNNKPQPAVFQDDGGRKLDIGFGLGLPSPHAADRRKSAEFAESQRLLYVAATRAKHYLAVLVGRAKEQDDKSVLEQTMTLPATMPSPGRRERLSRTLGSDIDTTALTIAPAPVVTRTYRRISFTGLTAGRGHHRASLFDQEGGGFDEQAMRGATLPPGPPDASAKSSREVIDLPAGVAVGSVVHEIFERIDTTVLPLEGEVRRVVAERATSGRLSSCHDNLVTIITETLNTPLGQPFGDITLASIGPDDRLPEMDFEMGLAALTDGVMASDLGKSLTKLLDDGDPLAEYAKKLSGSTFDVPVGGLLNGSIDAILRLRGSTRENPRLLLVDYKSNKLHRSGMTDPFNAYHPDQLVDAMADSHYPLQALLYGTANYRMLRWRLPDADPDDCIVGVAYAFIRGMKGPATRKDDRGHRYGVFAWTPPRGRGFWQTLSDVLVTPIAAGASP